MTARHRPSETSGTAQPSLQELLRRRRSGAFVGRQEELALFRANLATAPDDERHRFVFHAHGAAGVGKTYLVRQWEQIARAQGALTGVLDEHVTGVPEAMAALSAQFARQGREFRAFDKLMAVYRERRHEAESASAAGGSDALPAPGSVAAAQAGLAGLGMIPGLGPVAGALDPLRLAEAADRVRAALSARFRDEQDVRLVMTPVEVLTPVFVADLAAAAAGAPWAVLFFDTYERTGPLLDRWLRGIVLDGRYGDLPGNVVVALAGQGALDPAGWADSAGLVQDVPLEPFTDAEARGLLAAKGVTDEAVVESVLRLSGRLPVLVSTLAEARPAAPDAVDDPSDTAVERFLKWVDDPVRRDAALAAALPRRLDEDVFRAAVPTAGPGLYDWLRKLPFVDERAGRAGYHDVVRTAMLRLQRGRSPQRWREQHERLAAAFRDWRERETPPDASPAVAAPATPGPATASPATPLPHALADAAAGSAAPGSATAWDDDRWSACLLEETYHLLCADPRRALPDALARTARACAAGADTARSWAGMLAAAGADRDARRVREWGLALGEALTGGDEPVLRALTALLDGAARAEFDDAARASVYAQRAREHLRAGRSAAALADCDRALALGLDTAGGHALRGWLLWDLDRLDEAIDAFGAALAHDPEATGTYLMRGVCRALTGQDDAAEPDLDRALAADPAHREALSVRAGVRYRLGRHEDAASDLARWLELTPHDDPGRARHALLLASLHVAAGRPADALAHFRAAIEDSPTGPAPGAHAHRAMALLQLGRHQEALADLDHAVREAPGTARFLLVRAMVHRMLGAWDAALADADLAAVLDPQEPGVHRERAGVHLATGRWQEALDALAALLDSSPGDPFAYGMRCTVQLQLGHPEAALAELDRWLAAEPERFTVRSARGGLLSLLGRPDEAWADLDAAVAAAADAGPAAGGGGLLPTRIAFCRRSGRDAQARAELDRATAESPADPGVALEGLLVAARTAVPADDPAPWLAYERTLTSDQDPAPAGARGMPATLRALVRCALTDWPRADRLLDALLAADPSWLALAALEQDLGYLARCPGADVSRLAVRRDRVRAARHRMEQTAPPLR